MSKKMFNLVIGVTGGVAAIASVCGSDCCRCCRNLYAACIEIGSTAVTEICSLFVKTE